jgi:integrase
MAKITKRTVDALKPAGDRDAFLWDDELPGFGVRCRRSGAKVYFLKYRTAGGRQRWLTLGQHGPLAPDAARAKALREKAAIGDGDDPSGKRQKKRRENPVAAIADRYILEHVKAHNRASTAAEVGRIVEKRIKPGLGSFKITELTRSDIKAWHQGMSATPYEANRALAYCSRMLSLAATDWELRSDNPCIGVKRFPELARERFFTDDELAKIGIALSTAEAEGSEVPGFVLLVRLLATTGMRLSEALALTWPNVDLPGRAIRLPAAKTNGGARTVHLGAAAVAILDAVEERDGYVTHGLDPQRPLPVSTAEKAWAKLRERAGIPDARLHDLRHTAGTFAALSGANAFAVRDLLGHRTLAMTGRYVERAADMVRATADAMSGRVAAALIPARPDRQKSSSSASGDRIFPGGDRPASR